MVIVIKGVNYMKFKKSRIIGIGFSAFGIAALITFTAVANTIAEGYGDTLQAALGDLGKGHTNVSYDGVNPTYYENEFTDEKEKEEYQESVSYNIVKEGITLLEKGNIPYAKNTKVSLFSKSSVNFIFGGTGSGTASSSLNLKDVFEENGFDVNDSLWNFYKDGAGKKYQRGAGSINYGDSDDYSINECPLPVIQSDSKATNSFKEYDTAVFVLSRTGGEGNDLARGMNDYVDTSKDLSYCPLKNNAVAFSNSCSTSGKELLYLFPYIIISSLIIEALIISLVLLYILNTKSLAVSTLILRIFITIGFLSNSLAISLIAS